MMCTEPQSWPVISAFTACVSWAANPTAAREGGTGT